MQPGPVADLRVVSTSTAKGAGENGVAGAGTLHSESLAHDGAAAGDELQVGHAAAAGRSAVGGGRGGKGPQGRGRGLVQKRTHGPRLVKKRLHCGQEGSRNGCDPDQGSMEVVGGQEREIWGTETEGWAAGDF